MDNQQERLFNLGWFIGALESEGSFSLARSCRNKRGYRYTPLVTIVNSDRAFIDSCCEVLSEYKIPFYVFKRRKTNGVVKCNHGIISIIVRGYQRCTKLFNLITPLLKTKRDRAELLQKFINYRLSRPMKEPYGEYEDSIHKEMKRLNSILRDYTPNGKTEDIVRPA